MSSVGVKERSPSLDAAAGGNKKRRRRRVTTVMDEASCPTCSSCQSRLMHVADVTRASFEFVKCTPDALSCAACGSVLTPLRDLVR
ncbi:hypothetical protein SePPVgORF086 [Seal parapoxvirus]|uniref:Uncharacterized protein n=1 Tax=Seal parapoxvirus TaxID=187984 RepID=A0A1Z4CGF9_9POXV|nr:hypothetical protein CGV03_gp086 [Seal parapoxvirus]ASF89975.1 hypothetical protein SePPVgORF086 [Seal parapoxvirus]